MRVATSSSCPVRCGSLIVCSNRHHESKDSAHRLVQLWDSNGVKGRGLAETWVGIVLKLQRCLPRGVRLAGWGGRMEEEDEFETVHHAKPKFKPLPRQACQQDSRLVARVCDLARRGLTLAQIDADLREEGVWSTALRPPHLCA